MSYQGDPQGTGAFESRFQSASWGQASQNATDQPPEHDYFGKGSAGPLIQGRPPAPGQGQSQWQGQGAVPGQNQGPNQGQRQWQGQGQNPSGVGPSTPGPPMSGSPMPGNPMSGNPMSGPASFLNGPPTIPPSTIGGPVPHIGAHSGDVIGDRYQLVDLVGRGGNGSVWRATDTVLQREVAIKEVTIPAEIPTDEHQQLIERTFREAQITAGLSHPSVIRVFDVVQHRGLPWIVMELLKSRSLAEILSEDGPLPLRVVTKIGLALTGALEAAHEAGIIHRDIKPGNVLITADGRCILTDFGAAQINSLSNGTAAGKVIGSAHYIAPERAVGKPADALSDVFSLGVTLYATAEGRPPFDRGDAISTMRAVVNDPPESPQNTGPLTTLLAKMLAKEPLDRANLYEVRSGLGSLLSGPLSTGAPIHGLNPINTASLQTTSAQGGPGSDTGRSSQYSQQHSSRFPGQDNTGSSRTSGSMSSGGGNGGDRTGRGPGKGGPPPKSGKGKIVALLLVLLLVLGGIGGAFYMLKLKDNGDDGGAGGGETTGSETTEPAETEEEPEEEAPAEEAVEFDTLVLDSDGYTAEYPNIWLDIVPGDDFEGYYNPADEGHWVRFYNNSTRLGESNPETYLTNYVNTELPNIGATDVELVNSGAVQVGGLDGYFVEYTNSNADGSEFHDWWAMVKDENGVGWGVYVSGPPDQAGFSQAVFDKAVASFAFG